MKINKNIIMVTLFLFWIYALTAFALGEEIAIGINDIAVIQDADSHTRHILLKPDIPVPDTNIVINHANLSLRISPNTNDTTFISIRFYPITTDWDINNVNWFSPWSEPGGDYDEAYYAEFTITLPEEQDIQFDLTDIFQRWADSRLPYYGLLMGISESSLHELGPIIRNNDNYLASIVINYTTISIE